jgi:hypothetical protein
MFKFHLVPHVLGELCLQGQNSKKGAKGGLLEAIHVVRRGRAHRGPSPGARWRRLAPPRALPHH